MDGPQDLRGNDSVSRVQVEERHEHSHPREERPGLPLEVTGRPLFGLHILFGFLEGLLADPHFQAGKFRAAWLLTPVGHRLPTVHAESPIPRICLAAHPTPRVARESSASRTVIRS